MALRNIPLVMAKAEVRRLAGELKSHKADCDRAPNCETWKELSGKLRAARETVATWHEPGPDDAILF